MTVKIDPAKTTKLERLVVEAVEAMRDLAGALIEHMPPNAQEQIADVQVKLLQAVEAYDAE